MRFHFNSVQRFVWRFSVNRFLPFIVRFLRQLHFNVHRSVCVSFAFRLRFVSVLIVKNNGSGSVCLKSESFNK